jgi:hypothetical protein
MSPLIQKKRFHATPQRRNKIQKRKKMWMQKHNLVNGSPDVTLRRRVVA